MIEIKLAKDSTLTEARETRLANGYKSVETYEDGTTVEYVKEGGSIKIFSNKPHSITRLGEDIQIILHNQMEK